MRASLYHPRTRNKTNWDHSHCHNNSFWSPTVTTYVNLHPAIAASRRNLHACIMGPPSMVHEQYTGLPRWILTIHQVSVKDRRTFFHAVVTSVACFAAGHRKIFKQELAAFDVAHRKVLRRVVGPAARMDWSRPWHEILHDWKVRVSIFVGQAGLRPWPHTCLAISEICSACGKFTV